MNIKNIVSSFIILLSALLFSVAFFLPDQLGIMIIPSLALLILYFYYHNESKVTIHMYNGFFWGIIVYGLHFLWLLNLLLNKSHASKNLSYFLYGFITIYFSLISACLFIIIKMLFILTKRLACNPILTTLSITISAMIGYFYSIHHYSLWFLDKNMGYPFIDPLVPLTRIICFFCMLMIENNSFNQIAFVKPAHFYEYSKKATYEIFHNLDKSNPTKKEITYVAPESAYQYSLNKQQEIINFWSHQIPEQSNFFIGSHYLDKNNKLYQAIYWIQKSRIKKIYVKKHCVPLVEKMPKFLKRYTLLKQLFIKNKREFSSGKTTTVFSVTPEITIIPQICSEFFFRSLKQEIIHIKNNYQKTNIYIFLFVNDSWFVDYFKKIMENVTYLKALEFKIPILFIGHTHYKKIAFVS